MKRCLIFFTATIFLLGFGFSQTITVTSPNNGSENWKIGTKHDITWNVNNVSGDVTLKLYRGGTDLGRIASNAMSASLGTYSWKITSKLPNGAAVTPGSNYKVMVRHTSTINDLSNKYFTISAASSSTLLRLQRAKPRLPKKPEFYPDLYITYMKISPEKPVTDHQIECEVTVKNKGLKESKFCALDLEIKKGRLSKKLQDHIPVLAPGSSKLIRFKYSSLQVQTPPRVYVGGEYTNRATIDPTKISGENGMARLNNSKSIKYYVDNVRNRPDLTGCMTQISNYKLYVLCKNTGPKVMPISQLVLKIFFYPAGSAPRFQKRVLALKPGETSTTYFDVTVIKNWYKLFGADENHNMYNVTFRLDFDGLNSAIEISGSNRIEFRIRLKELKPPIGNTVPITINKCASNYK